MIQFISIILNPINSFINYITDTRISNNIKKELFTHVINCDIQFFEIYKSGELVSLFNRNLKVVKRAATG